MTAHRRGKGRSFLLAAALWGCSGILPPAASARVNYKRLLKEIPTAAEKERPLMIRALGRSRRKKAEPFLLDRLAAVSPVAETAAVASALGELGYAEAAGPLAALWERLLDSHGVPASRGPEADALRAAVAEGLAKTAPAGNMRAAAALRRGAVDPDPRIVRAALSGLGRLRDEGAIALASSRLGSADGGVSRAAAEALAAIGGEQAESALRSGRESSDPRTRVAAACGLGRLGVKVGFVILDGFLEEVEGANLDGIAAASCLAGLGKTNGLSYLVSAARAPDSALRLEAIAALGESGSERAVLPLSELLLRPDPAVRRAVVRALESLGGDRAAFQLRRLRGDPDQELREAARRARAALGDYEAP